MLTKSFSHFAFPGCLVALLIFASPSNGTCLSDQIIVTPNSEIVFEGDSLTYGFDESEIAGEPKSTAHGHEEAKFLFRKR